jgi:asparagine synthase (glutamine-hydrolysing)
VAHPREKRPIKIMCGLLGCVSIHSSTFIDRSDFSRLLDSIKNRGPDAQDIWSSSNGQVLLGHARLSILDLTEHAKQPMKSDCGRYIIVFNGEIYNFSFVRQKLINEHSCIFVSSGDTEVVLAAYKVWGEKCLSFFNGMFAFAIYDQGTNEVLPSLFFARDRSGEKPFYYSLEAGVFSFASELKALNHGGNVNLTALNFYLSLGYIPSDLCLFEGVKKLPPAHCGKFLISSGKVSIRRYWALPINHPKDLVSGEELVEESGALIEDSVRLRLIADVPVGVLLSGGLDSSLVTAAAAHVSSRPIETFTVSIPGSGLDESGYAKKVAHYFGTKHHELPLGETSLDLIDVLAPFIDEPIADSSMLPAWVVFGLARKDVKVVLGGDGGDELFGGYSDYLTAVQGQEVWGLVPQILLKTLSSLAQQFPAGVFGRNKISSIRGGPFQQLIWGTPYFDGGLRRNILTKDAINTLGRHLNSPEEYLLSLYDLGSDPIDSMTRTHFLSILPDDFLVKVDRASMASSIEARSPFLDHRLIEFAFGKVPSDWKVFNGESRRLERMLAKKWLPQDLDINRKQGFSIPINEWLRAEGEDALMERMDGLPDVIRMDEVRKLVRGHIKGRSNGSRLFSLIMLAIAMRNSKK